MGLSQSSVLEACGQDDLSKLKKFCRSCKKKNSDMSIDMPFSDDHQTILHMTIQGDSDVKGSNFLIVEGADPNALTARGTSPLHIAAKTGKESTVALLLKYGADVVITDNNHRNALHFAAIGGFEQIASKLLNRMELADINVQDCDGNTPLHHAAQKGYHEIVLNLVRKGCDVNLRNKAGKTALAFAFKKRGMSNVVRALCHSSLQEINPRELDVNIRDMRMEEIAIESSKKGYLPILRTALSSSNFPQWKDQNGRLCLEAAIMGGRTEAVSMLLEAGISASETVWVKEKEVNLVVVALCKNQPEIMRIMLDHGANVNSTDDTGRTLLALATTFGIVEAVQILLDRGANTEFTDTNGNNLVIICITGNTDNHFQILDLLLSHGGNPNSVAHNKNTALIQAIHNNNYNMFDLLMRKGADPTVRGANRRLPIQAARQCHGPNNQFCAYLESMENGLVVGVPVSEKTVSMAGPPTTVQPDDAEPSAPPIEESDISVTLDMAAHPYIEQSECAFCLENFEGKRVITIEQCGHQYCVDCSVKYAQTKGIDKMICDICSRSE